MNLDAYTLTTLTAAINRYPMSYGRCNELGLFPERPIATRTAMIDTVDGELNLIPAHEWGGPGSWAKRDVRGTKAIPVPQTVHSDDILPEDVQDVRAFGTENAAQPMAAELAMRLQTIRRKHDITLEWRRMGALRGSVLNANGSDVLIDLFASLAPAGVTQKTADFKFSVAATKIRKVCMDVHRLVEDALRGDTYTSVRAFCSTAFFDALVDHKDVAATFLNHQAAVDQQGGDLRRGFRYGDIIFEEYRGKVTSTVAPAANNPLLFVPDGEAIAFPIGTQNTFQTLVAPADFNETVNTRGKMFYAKVSPKKNDRGYELHTQSNNLPVCLKPDCVIRLTQS